MSDATQIVAKHFATTGQDTSRVIARTEDVRIRTAIYTGITDADATTLVLLNELGLKDPIILGITVSILNGTNQWEFYDNRDGNTAANAFRVEWNDPNNANPNQLIITNVGAAGQGVKFRVIIFYVEAQIS